MLVPGTPGAATSRTYAPDFLLEMFQHPLDAGYADAAAARAASGPPRPAARRAGFALRTLTLIAAGVLLAIAYQQTVAAQPESSKVRQGLVNDVRARQADTDNLQKQAASLQKQASELRDQVLLNAQAQALRNLESITGLGAVSGDGVAVSLSDGPAPTDPVTGQPLAQDPAKIVDFDLQSIANELWRDGAEAIAINDQRLTATSTIRLAGNAILVNLEPLAEPYVIQAIGPSSLTDSLKDSVIGGDYRSLAETVGLHFSVDSRKNLNLPAASDPQLHFAQVIKPPSQPTSASPPAPTGSPTSTGGR